MWFLTVENPPGKERPKLEDFGAKIDLDPLAGSRRVDPGNPQFKASLVQPPDLKSHLLAADPHRIHPAGQARRIDFNRIKAQISGTKHWGQYIGKRRRLARPHRARRDFR